MTDETKQTRTETNKSKQVEIEFDEATTAKVWGAYLNATHGIVGKDVTTNAPSGKTKVYCNLGKVTE